MTPDDAATTPATEPAAPRGGPLKAMGWVGPASERLEQEVLGGLKGVVEKIARVPDAPQWTLIRRLASVEELRALADDPPSGLIDALAPVLCPMLAWVRMIDPSLPSRSKQERVTWNASEPFKAAVRALQNGWYEDALEAFRKAIEECPEDFVSLYGFAQLQCYWEGDPEAALPALEKAARYAVPVGARPWMKAFAAQALLTRADLLVRLHEDYGLAHQHLANAEEHLGPNAEVELARARIAARSGNAAEVSRRVAAAIGHGWFYAIQVALDPAFPALIADAVHEALDRTRSGLVDASRGNAEQVATRLAAALAEDDSGLPADRIADARSAAEAVRAKAEALLADRDASLLDSLALGDRMADLTKAGEQAISRLEGDRRRAREELERNTAAEEMSEVETQRQQVAMRRQRLAEAEAGATERMRVEAAEQVEALRKEIIHTGIRTYLTRLIPVLLLVLIYHFTEIRTSPSFAIGGRGSGAAAAAESRRKAPTLDMGAKGDSVTPAAPTVGRSQIAPGGAPGGGAPGAAAGGTGSGLAVTPGGTPGAGAAANDAPKSYHDSLDRGVWLLFFLYLFGMAGLVGYKQWGELLKQTEAIEKRAQAKADEIIADLEKQRAPLDEEYRRLSARVDHLRARI